MKENAKKRVTMEGIAKLITGSQNMIVERLDKRITESYESLARSVAEGFAGVDKRFDGVEAEAQKFKEDTEQNFVKIRNDILNLDNRFVPRHEFENRMKVITVRVSKVVDAPRR